MLEYKTNPIEELKFNDDEWLVEGYATVWNSVDKVGDRILPGAFTKSLASGNGIRMHLEHLRGITPGKWDKAVEDEKGLYISGHLTRDHSVAKDLRASMRHGTIKAFSQGFRIREGGSKRNDKGGRDISDIDLVEVSFTADPAEPNATIESFKSMLEGVDNIRDMEAFLRDSVNLSKSMATALISHVKQLCRSESEQENAEKLRELQAAVQLKAVFDKYDLRKLVA
jgi:HK97 family phage prohead protease